MKQKNLITVVTDHQLTADTIARAIGANEKHEGYYLGNGYAVTWTNGRVIEATFSPDESFVLSTNMDCRLVYAHNFKFAMRDYDHLVGYKKTAEDTKQLATIKALWKMSRTVVNAMIPEIGGDLDFLNIYYFIACPVEVHRAWLPILTKGAIRHGIMHGPADITEYETWLGESIYNHLVKATQESVALVGDPIVEEVSTVQAEKDAEKLGIPAPKEGDYGFADNYVAVVTDALPLYNLTALMVDAATELDFDHQKTIQTAYTLYAKKLISYPLVMQNTIPAGVWKLMRRNKEVLRFNGKWGASVPKGKPSRRHNFRLGENRYNGHGIVTTGLHPTDLTRDEEKLYNLIVRRVIDAFALSPAEKRAMRKKSRRNRKSKVKSA